MQRKLPQPGKDQYLPSAVLQVQRCSYLSLFSCAVFNPIALIFLCVSDPSLQLIFCSKLATLRQFVHSFAFQWLPIFILLGTSPNKPSDCANLFLTCQHVSFSDPMVSSPSPSSAPPHDSPGTVFAPGEEVFARPGSAAPSQPPQTRYPSRQQAPPKRLNSDLFSSQPRPELGGSPVESCLHPWRRSNQSGAL